VVDDRIRRRLTWGVLTLALLAGLLSVALRVVLPSDGARIPFYAAAWTADGVRIEPIDAPAEGLQAGDLISSVDGRPLSDWLADAVDSGVARPSVGGVYGLGRDGAMLVVPVTWAGPAVGATLLQGWSIALASVAIGVLAGWVYRRRPDTPAATALVLAAAAIAGSSIPWFLGVTVSDLVRGTPFVLHAIVTGPIYMLLWPAAIHLASVFPTPAIAVRRHRTLIPLVYGICFAAYAVLTLGGMWTLPLLVWVGTWPSAQVAVVVPATAIAITIFIIRYVRATDPADRARRRLATLGIVGSAVLGLLVFMGPALVTGRPLVPDAAIGLILLPLPLALAFAIVHDRLFDIDVAIRRTLVYGGLTLSVLAVYAGAVVALTQALGEQEYAVSLLATGVAALAALPLRDALQRAVDRLLYGERGQPVQVMRRLGMQLEWAADPARAFPAVADTLADALHLPYVALEVTDELGRAAVVAERGERPPAFEAVPLVHGGEAVGRLVVGLRSGEPSFDPAEQTLLRDLARQVGAAVHAQRLRDELARSRERLVMATEDERRRLRRDLHDGLGPTLAAVAMRAEAAAAALSGQRDAASRDLTALTEDVRSAIADLRRLVDGLRPPSLDELGLAGAIREQVTRLADDGTPGRAPVITVECRPAVLPDLPAAVEVAAYRIAIEAVTNTVRHADARTCVVTLVADARLTVEIRDDGLGLDPDRPRGVGLESMDERAAEVGGALILEPLPRGMIVRAELPLRTMVEP
jgi:two-component system NarL family sensor kinase